MIQIKTILKIILKTHTKTSCLSYDFVSFMNAPLLVVFETEKSYRDVKDRYFETLSKLSKVQIILNFNNPELVPHPPQSVEIISCD